MISFLQPVILPLPVLETSRKDINVLEEEQVDQIKLRCNEHEEITLVRT